MYTIISIVCSIKVKLLKKKWDHVWSRIANKHLLRVKWKRVANCYKNRRKNPEDGRQSSLFVRNTVYPPCDKGGVRALVKSTTRAKKRIFKIGWRAREKELVHFVGTSPLLFWFLAKKGGWVLRGERMVAWYRSGEFESRQYRVGIWVVRANKLQDRVALDSLR